MTFTILTLLTALALATVAGWFSIIGIMAILAGAPMHALVAGVTIEIAKLVTTSWIYRNWNFASWKLRILLMFFTVLIMIATSMGVFGFLSKAHLEQGASTVDNAAKVEQINQQIAREKATIDYAEKTLTQLDATLDSYIGKDRADRSVVIRNRQAPQRKQLKDEIAASLKQINTLNDEKFKLESEVRKLQLEVGPIRYISELIYGAENNSDKNIESAVRIFILLIVLTLDPLAVTLLVAANNSLLRHRREKEEKNSPSEQIPTADGDTESGTGSFDTKDFKDNEDVVSDAEPAPEPESFQGRAEDDEEAKIHVPLHEEALEYIDEEAKDNTKSDQETSDSADMDKVHGDIVPGILQDPSDAEADRSEAASIPEEIVDDERAEMEQFRNSLKSTTLPVFAHTPKPSRVEDAAEAGEKTPWMFQADLLPEMIGTTPHFVPKKVTESVNTTVAKKNLKILNWLNEFKRS